MPHDPASTLGYVDHAAHWTDTFGLDGVSHIVEVDKALENIARVLEALRTVHSTAAHGQSCPPGNLDGMKTMQSKSY